ncbi:hypothetical protein [Deefgea piscis]|uniref:hypothetical protein n=1 Tax=Deefgea piscis TaxID=2739061 RepID=UPI001C7F2994|nr:hypothetical protein [Deefgea piscis]QZA80186.1 hypothetical protein K4H25_11650 [Deefgea piscis]
MFDPARFMATFARHGLLESAVIHAQGGDVTVDVGVSENDVPTFEFMSAESLTLEFAKSALLLDVDVQLTFRGERWRIHRAPMDNGAFIKAQIQKVNP